MNLAEHAQISLAAVNLVAAARVEGRINHAGHEPQNLGIIRSLFKAKKLERVIIFASSKLKVKEVARSLKQMHLNVGEMHSDLDQAQRDEVMYSFKAGHIAILVATDIVARGIDIDDITMVINYDVPHDSEDYVHRIGRTARAGSDGEAITFVSDKEQRRFAQIEKFLGKSVNKLPLPAELGESPEYKGEKSEEERGGRGRGRDRGRGKKEGKRRKGSVKATKKEAPIQEKEHKPVGEAVNSSQTPAEEAVSTSSPGEAEKQKGEKKRRRNHRGGRNRRRGRAKEDNGNSSKDNTPQPEKGE